MRKGMHELQELFSIDIDSLMIMARLYKWNQNKMQGWLLSEE